MNKKILNLLKVGLLCINVFGLSLFKSNETSAVPISSIILETNKEAATDQKKYTKKLIDFYIRRIIHKFPKKLENSFGKVNEPCELPINDENYRKEAELFCENAKKFIEESDKANIPVDKMNDYFISRMATSTFDGKVKRPTVKGSTEFRKQEGMLVYRGVNEERFAENTRRGEVYIGGKIKGGFFYDQAGSLYGNGIYTTNEYNYALMFTKKEHKIENAHPINNVDHKRIINMKIDPSAKMITDEHLNKVIDMAACIHPEYFSMFMEKEKIFLNREDYYSSPIELVEEAFKNVYGSTIEDTIKKFLSLQIDKASDLDYLDLSDEALDNIQNLINEAAEKLVKESPKFGKEMNRLLMSNKQQPYIKNKLAAIYVNPGIVAWLLGYDVLKSRLINENRNLYYYNVVNPGVLTICSDASEDNEVTLEKSFEEHVGFNVKQ